MCEKCEAVIALTMRVIDAGEIPAEIKDLIPPIPPPGTYSLVNVHEFYTFVGAVLLEAFQRGQRKGAAT